MPEPTKPPAAMGPAKEEPAKKPAHAEPVPAAESSDPTVHTLLAERASHEQALATADEAARLSKQAAEGGAQARIDEIDGLLADLGYSAK